MTPFRTAVLIGFIALASALLWGGRWLSRPVNDDAAGYAAIARNVASGRGFTDEHGALTKEREPGYPLFLAGVFRVFGERPGTLLAVQAALFALTVLLAWAIARTLWGEGAAFAGGLASAILPSLAASAGVMLTEVPFAFLLTLGIFLFLRSVEKDTLLLMALAGAVFGAALEVRALGLIPAAVFGVWALLAPAPSRARRTVRIAVFAAAFAVVVTPWVVRNGRQFGTWALMPRSGAVLNFYSRALTASLPSRDAAAYVVASVAGDYPATLLFSTFTGVAQTVYTPLEPVITGWVAAHPDASSSERDAHFREISLGIVRAHPVQFLLMSIPEFVRLHQPMLETLDTQHLFVGTHPELPGWAKLALVLGLRGAWFFGLLLAAYGAWKGRADWRILAIASFILLFGAAGAAFYVVPRYLMPLHPLYLALAAAGGYEYLIRRRATV